MKTFVLIFILNLSGCQNYVKNMHQQISQDQNKKKQGPNQGKQLRYYRTKKNDRRAIKDPITYSTSPVSDLRPNVRREYKTYKKRHNAEDLADNSEAPSLWANYTNSADLFSTNKKKLRGDIVVIAVNKNMKEDISRELRKAFPKNIARSIPAGGKMPTKNNKEAEASKAPASEKKPEEDKEEAVIIFDKVSSRVSEEVGQDYVLLKGRKEVYFRNQKRLIELHALTKRSSISSNDEIMSDKVTESKVFVIR